MPTVASLKTTLQAQIAPNNDSEFLRLLTEADLRLLEYCRFRWTRGRVTLTPAAGIITLPAGYSSILGAQVDGAAKWIHDEHYEFTPDGLGEVEVAGCGSIRLIDQGLTVAGLRHYKVTGTLEDDWTIYALCHFAPVTLFDAAIGDSTVPDDAVDTTRCPDVAALKLFMLGIIMEEASNIEESSKYFSAALRGLENKEKTQRGGSRQTFNIRPNGPGIRGIRSLR